MFAKTVLAVALFATIAQVVLATPPACVLAAVKYDIDWPSHAKCI